jgi:hypothetical protein
MTTFINASASAGLIITPDTSGVVALQNNGVTGLNISSSGQVTMPLNVCFSAYAQATSAGNTIVYNNAYVNVGGGLNTSTGAFTAPVAGVYYLSAQFLANGGQGDLNLRVNGTQRAGARGNSTTAAVSLHYQLAVGDVVTVYVSGTQAYGDGSGWSIFSGRLIQ